MLNAIAPRVPWLIGGAADLAPSTKTRMTEGEDFEAGSYGGRNFHFGIREHAMGAILNGMTLSKVRAYGSGFLIFSDYMRGAIRLGDTLAVQVKDSDPWGNEPIYVGDKMVGRATSGAYGYTLGKSLAVGYVRPDYAAPGTRLEMILLGERYPAEVVPESPWDPENARLRA